MAMISTAGVCGDFGADRLSLVKRIREEVRRAAPAAADRELDRALAAIVRIPREEFVAPSDRAQAYADTPLPIGYDQTISDTYIVALTTAAARLPDHANVLDVGTGSGYQAAVLAELGAQVTSIEIVRPLADEARARLARLKYRQIDVRAGDGYAGAADRAPFDAIIVAAGAAAVPQPLLDQLKVGGRIVMPIGPSWASEQLLVLTKTDSNTFDRCSLGWTMYVPLTGQGARVPNASGLMDRKIRQCFGVSVAKPSFSRLKG
ncbi:protein-L-isoaspartate(D-aspartate) O-methyltransferase [Sphingomonas panacisoli]|uniref:Protein-L-isoaspartate O-methyltransferase n=2 Tax=Sphingomonas panacisoli TaxID=1813879 RepID=A0A5B8LNE4_9SPHN|nr:protein-L-isoaspartate(D-aspartate) O-methyltransferase [Sphingomonas panacisoli]